MNKKISSKPIAPVARIRQGLGMAAAKYAAAQISLALLISLIQIENNYFLRDLFSSLGEPMPTFRTMFALSSNPIEGQLFLLTWWIVFIPWGVIWIGRFTDGFTPMVVPSDIWQAITQFSIFILVAGVLTYMHAFWDHGYMQTRGYTIPSRATLIPSMAAAGVFPVSIWLALASTLLVASYTGLIFGFKYFANLLFKVERKK